MAATAAASGVTATPPPIELTPADEWIVTNDQNGLRCTISRAFLAQGRAVRIAVDLSLAGGVSGSATFAQVKDLPPYLGLAILTPLPDGAGLKLVGTAAREVPSGAVKASFVMDWNSQRSFLAALATTAGLRVWSKTQEYVVDTGPMRAVFGRLVACHNAALRSLGVAPDAMVYRPGNEAVKFLPTDDLPSPPYAARSGSIVALVTIDRGGHARACRIVQASGYPDFDLQTCRALAHRGHYATALPKDPDVRYSATVVLWGGGRD